MINTRFFISYSRKDSAPVLKLAQELRVAQISLWLDQLDITAGQRWDKAIEQAMKNCNGTLLVLSPDSIISENVLDEMSYALEEKKRIIPVIIRPCEIPYRLRRIQHINLSNDYKAGFQQLLRELNSSIPLKSVSKLDSSNKQVITPAKRGTNNIGLWVIGFLLFLVAVYSLYQTNSTDTHQEEKAPYADKDNAYQRGKKLYDAQEYETALPLLRQAADQGSADAKLLLSFMYSAPMGVDQDEKQGINWLQKAADENQSVAQFLLGVMYEDGSKLGVDTAKANYWYRKSFPNLLSAANQNDPLAQMCLCQMYDEGSGIKQDDTQSVYWCRRAADQGYAEAQYVLGDTYLIGNNGVAIDTLQAIALYQKSARQGNKEAQYTLKNLGKDW